MEKVRVDYSALVEKLKQLVKKPPQGVMSLKDVKGIVRKPKKGTGFRRFLGKEIIITDIQFKEDTAVVRVEVDGKEEEILTRDKLLIKRYLIDFKVALDLGAEGIKVKVEPLGKSSVKFV